MARPKVPVVTLSEKLAYTMPDLAALTGLSQRTLWTLNKEGSLPGRCKVGRRILFTASIIRAWVEAGMPDKETWETLQRVLPRR